MIEQSKKDFLESLKVMVEFKLKSAGVVGITVETYEKDGEPVAEISGGTFPIIAAQKALKSYASMVRVKRSETN